MLKKKTILVALALAGAIAAFFYAKGDKITQVIGSITAAIGTLGLNEIALYVGIVFTVLSYITHTLLTWYYKHERHKMLKAALVDGASIEQFLDNEE